MHIFTLPMRHWNPNDERNERAIEWHFYPTYEALKLDGRVDMEVFETKEFLPYLWGIETENYQQEHLIV